MYVRKTDSHVLASTCEFLTSSQVLSAFILVAVCAYYPCSRPTSPTCFILIVRDKKRISGQSTETARHVQIFFFPLSPIRSRAKNITGSDIRASYLRSSVTVIIATLPPQNMYSLGSNTGFPSQTMTSEANNLMTNH